MLWFRSSSYSPSIVSRLFPFTRACIVLVRTSPIISFHYFINIDMARTEPHMLAFPKGLLALRIIQAVLALIILALCGYGLSVLPLDGTGLELFAVSTPRR